MSQTLLREAWQSILKNMQYVAAFGTVGLSTAMMYPDIWGVPRMRTMLQMYRDGQPEPVEEESTRFAQQVFDKVLWDATTEASVELFMAYGQDVIHRGSTYTKKGAIIGVPINFKYRTPTDVEKEKITLNNANIDWNSEPGQKLLDSLILSEKARKFAIARELFYAHTLHMYMKGGTVVVSCFTAYWMGFAANTIYGLSRRLPTPSRVVIYSFFTGIGATLYCFLSDTYHCYRDRKVDAKAAELGAEYAEGGVEFYNKQCQRNIALRALMGANGGKRYTAYGNDIHFWRTPNMPLTARRDKLQGILKTLESAGTNGDASSDNQNASA